MGTLYNAYECNFRVILASTNKLCLYMLWWLYFKRKLWQEANNFGSQTSEHGHSKQCTILGDFQAKELQSIYAS